MQDFVSARGVTSQHPCVGKWFFEARSGISCKNIKALPHSSNTLQLPLKASHILAMRMHKYRLHELHVQATCLQD